jgi:hypothetical protein
MPLGYQQIGRNYSVIADLEDLFDERKLNTLGTKVRSPFVEMLKKGDREVKKFGA